MAEWTAAQFAEFYQAVHGDPPFHWQKRLAEQVLGKEGWPDVIRVPTGCGKTSVLDIALFELASQAGWQPEQRTAARRICFVIDRRLVVDEIAEHARRLYRAIMENQTNDGKSILHSVKEALASLAADPAEPLRVVRLRGAVYRDDSWAADPLTPTILISTVDQIGSRLLFRGYGVSRRSRPVQAGLLAFDTRIILDEAHLSTVFAETLDRIRQYQLWAEKSPLPQERLVSIVRMSATAGEGQRIFELTDQERRDERLKLRLEATKSAELIKVEVKAIKKEVREKQPRKARKPEGEHRAKLVEQLAEKAEQFSDNGPAVIGVVVNRVATARQVFERLRQQGEGQPKREALLLTGRIRPYDRDRLLRDWLPKIKAGRETNPEKVLFVVATQTVEVGANIDFDALVTEAASLDALRQRFGRLHRIPDKPQGRPQARAAILIRSDQIKNSEDDPIYGQSIAKTWTWLNEGHNKGPKKKKSKKDEPTTVDFGINQLDPKLPKTPDEMRLLLAPQPEAPLLFPAHLDAWVQTNPMPDPDPDVGPFLHGPADAAVDVQVVWRADLDEKNHKIWPDVVRLMPPRIREALPVPLYELQAWLKEGKEGKEHLADIADVEGVKTKSERERNQRGRRVLRWRGLQDAKVVGPDQIRPGDTVVIPASYGGADEFGWNPVMKGSVRDIAESCLAELIASYPRTAFRRPRLRLRLHWLLFEALVPDKAAQAELKTLLQGALGVSEEDEDNRWNAVKSVLSTLRGHLCETAFRAAVDALLQSHRRPQIDHYPERDGLVVSAFVPVKQVDDVARVPIEDAEYEEPEGDETSLAPAGREIMLADHTEDVKNCVEDFACCCGLADDFKSALVLAAEWHDQGKRDRRFQAWLHGSELKALAALASGKPLAKSGRDLSQWGRADAFGYPRGMRHEFVSIRLLEAAQEKQSDSELFDLARFLIGTHHGFGRPFAPVTKDRNWVLVSVNHNGREIKIRSNHQLYRLNSGWVDLFWQMVRRYGWWGLAYLESLLITADHLASAREQQQSANQVEEAVA